DFQPKYPRLLLLVLKGRIGILREPLVVVKCRMIHTIRAAGADVRGRHSEVLQKGRVIRSAAQVSDTRAMLGDAALPILVEPKVGMPLFRLARLLLYPVRVHSSPSRAGNLLRHVTYKLLQRRYSLGVKIRPGYSNIHVEIGHRVRKLARM